MSKRAYAILSGLCLAGAVTTALVVVITSSGGGTPDMEFAGMTFTGLLGMGGTLAGRGTDPEADA